MAPPNLNGSGLERDDIQGLLATGHGRLPASSFLLFGITDAVRAARWLGRIADQVTTASDKPDMTALQVALAPEGLVKLGLPVDVLAGFSDRFIEGMTAPHRSRALGDVDDRAPEHWEWGGPSAPTVDVLVLLYARDADALADLERRLAPDGLALIRRLDGDLTEREHFGFKDGISQPGIEGLREQQPDTVKAGEFILGYPNEYGLLTDPALGDLGRNGTYLVLRELTQDVGGFWRFMDRATRGPDGVADAEARTKLAAKAMGRWPGGAPLVLAPERPDDALDDANDFAYHHADPHGLRCPIGSHIRRAHPRDSLDPAPGTERSLEVDRRHRILRRGRLFGPRLSVEEALSDNGSSPPAADEPRGLHFVALCANIARQFEFVQHTWIENPKFDGLYDDADPVIGPAGRTFTVQAEPVRKRVRDLPSFVGIRGGGYFFLPGIRALRSLAARTSS